MAAVLIDSRLGSAVDEKMRISRVLFLKTKAIGNPNFHL
jgi:hypothetical protein